MQFILSEEEYRNLVSRQKVLAELEEFAHAMERGTVSVEKVDHVKKSDIKNAVLNLIKNAGLRAS